MENMEVTPEEKEKILKTFFKDGKLDQMPAQAKKKMVVFEELVKNFEFDKTYTEFEVTKILKPIYFDFATVRRDLVDNGFFSRDNGVYKRIK